MTAWRIFFVALRKEARARAALGLAALVFLLSIAIAISADAAEARGLFAFGVIPLAITLFVVRAAIERASLARRSGVDFERLYSAGSFTRITPQVLARALVATLTFALALSALEWGLASREAAGTAPIWTARPFASVVRKRLDQVGQLARLPAFEIEAHDFLVIPLRWRGNADGTNPIQLAVRWRDVETQATVDETFYLSNSRALRMEAQRTQRAEMELLFAGGRGEVRLDLHLAAIERGATSIYAGGSLLVFHLFVLVISLTALLAALTTWLKPGLCLVLSGSCLLWLVLDPLQLSHWQPAPHALLELRAWASGRPVPFHTTPCIPFLALTVIALAIASIGDRRRIVP